MRLRLPICCAALVISLNCLYPQDQLPGHIINLLEDISGLSDDDLQARDYAEELTSLAEDPVNINSSDETELRRLFFLTEFQIRSIIDYRKNYGNILSAMEMSYIPGFDKELASLIMVFTTFEFPEKKKTVNKGNHMRFLLNFIQQDGKNEDYYIGPSYKLLSKTRLSSGPLEACLTIDKDKGEPIMLPGGQPDFLSASISYSPEKVIKKIIIGDFKVRFGQGLTVWNGFSRSTVPTEKRLMKGRSGMVANSSSEENDFFRGIAASSRIYDININVFASMNMIDANTAYNDESMTTHIKSFYDSGIHNTTTTLMKRDQVTENSFGLNINGMYDNLYCGINAVYTLFSLPVIPKEDIRNTYDFKGRTNAVFSIDYAYLFKDSFIFGEFALHNMGKTAFLHGISLNPEGRARFNLMYSRVNRGFNSFHGNVSGMSAFNRPGRSFIANTSFELGPSFSFSCGFLDRKELWYSNISGSFPSSMLYMVKLKFQPADFISLAADIKHRISDYWVNPLQGVKASVTLRKTNLRLTAETKVSESFILRTRIEQVMVDGTSETGFLCYQSGRYIFNSLPLEIRGRITVFNTGSYETRIYAWEDDLLYNPFIKTLYGEGNRSYIMIIYCLKGKLTIRAKYALSSITGGHDSYGFTDELNFQLVFSF